MSSYDDLYEGQIIECNECNIRVSKKTNAHNIEIYILVGGGLDYKRTVQYTQISKGNIRNLYYPNTYGVGYLGIGKFKTRDLGKVTLHYRKWSGMLERCYSDKYHQKKPTYKDCTVCEEWHNFQNFAKWIQDKIDSGEYQEGYHLDKDIKINGNKIYSPDTCMFVSPSINSKSAMDNRDYKQHEVDVIHETGSIVTIKSRVDFANKYNINVNDVYRLVNELNYNCCGWRLKK